MSEMITLEDHGDVAVLRLSHGRVSALDIEVCHALTDTVRAHADTKAIVLTGTGSVFSAGVDLRRIRDDGPSYNAEFLPAVDEAFLAVFEASGRSSRRSTGTPSPEGACWPPHATCG
jgi:enoyl-CoA hydratase